MPVSLFTRTPSGSSSTTSLSPTPTPSPTRLPPPPPRLVMSRFKTSPDVSGVGRRGSGGSNKEGEDSDTEEARRLAMKRFGTAPASEGTRAEMVSVEESEEEGEGENEQEERGNTLSPLRGGNRPPSARIHTSSPTSTVSFSTARVPVLSSGPSPVNPANTTTSADANAKSQQRARSHSLAVPGEEGSVGGGEGRGEGAASPSKPQTHAQRRFSRHRPSRSLQLTPGHVSTLDIVVELPSPPGEGAITGPDFATLPVPSAEEHDGLEQVVGAMEGMGLAGEKKS